MRVDAQPWSTRQTHSNTQALQTCGWVRDIQCTGRYLCTPDTFVCFITTPGFSKWRDVIFNQITWLYTIIMIVFFLMVGSQMDEALVFVTAAGELRFRSTTCPFPDERIVRILTLSDCFRGALRWFDLAVILSYWWVQFKAVESVWSQFTCYSNSVIYST